MENFVQNLKVSLDAELQAIEDNYVNFLIAAEKSAYACNDAMLKLKTFVDKYQFPTEGEEIRFFKELKPSIHKHLIYYSKIYEIESRRPIGSIPMVKQYLNDELNHLKRFFDKNATLYQYIRLEKKHFDHIFFLRKGQDNIIITNGHACEKDPNFSSLCDFKVSKIEANHNLIQYLKFELARLEITDINAMDYQKTLKWTGAKVWLVELAYSLYWFGVVNHGNATIIEIIRGLEQIFHIDLGHCYESFADIRKRKINPTKFLDKLKEKVQQKINEPFERY